MTLPDDPPDTPAAAWSDPILEEVRRARDALAAKHDYDLDRLVAALTARTKASARPIASFSPRRVTNPSTDA